MGWFYYHHTAESILLSFSESMLLTTGESMSLTSGESILSSCGESILSYHHKDKSTLLSLCESILSP